MSTAHSGNRRDFLKQVSDGRCISVRTKSRVVVARDELLRGTGSTVDSAGC
jgi:hypothetical protein